MINTLFLGDKIQKKKKSLCVYCSNLCCSVLKVDEKNYPQVYLGQCKYKMKKRELVSIIDDEVILSSDYESDNDSLNSLS